VKNDTAANAYWSVSYDSGMTFTNGTLTLTGTEWQVGPGLQIEQPATPAFVQQSNGAGEPTVVSLNSNPTIGNFLAFVALTGTTPPPASFEDFPLITSGIADGYYSGIYGDFATSTISPTLVAGGAVESFRCLYEYTNVASVVGQDPTIGVSGTITPLSGSFSLSETLPCVGLSMVLTSTTGTDGNEYYSTPPNAVIRDYFTTLPFVNQGFSTVELPFPKGAGQVNLNYTGSGGIILVYVNAPTLLMISGGLINYPEIYALPTTIENQGSIIGVARTFNAGAGLGYTTDGNIATLNNQGVLSIGGDTGSILLGPSLSMTGQTLNVQGIGTIDALIGTVSTSIATLNAGANISFSGTSPELTISSSGGSVSGTIGIEYAGTLYPTLAAGSNVTLTGSGATLTVSSSGGGGGTIGIEYAGTLYPTLAAGSNVTLTGSGATLSVSSSGGGGGGSTYPQIVQSARIVGGGTLALPNPPTIGNYLAVFVNQQSALANFDGIPLLQTVGSGTTQSFLFGQVATSTTPISEAIVGNGYICEVSGASSVSSNLVSIQQVTSGGTSNTWGFNFNVNANSVIFVMNAPFNGPVNDDAVFVAPLYAKWLTSGVLVGSQCYGFFVWEIECPTTQINQQFSFRTVAGQPSGTVAVLSLTT
jgi:hypothetical protein